MGPQVAGVMEDTECGGGASHADYGVSLADYATSDVLAESVWVTVGEHDTRAVALAYRGTV